MAENIIEKVKKMCRENACVIFLVILWVILSISLLLFVVIIFRTDFDFTHPEYQWYDIATTIFYILMIWIICYYLCFDKKENPNFTTLEFVVSVLAIGDGTYNLTRFLNQLNDYVESKKLPELSW